MDPQELFNELKTACMNQKGNKKGNKPKKIDHDKMWSCLFDLAAQSVRTIGMYYPLVLFYQERFPDFRTKNSKIVSEYLNKYSNEKLSIEDATKLCCPLALLSPFLSIENIVRFFDISVNISYKYMIQNNDIPLAFIDIFDQIMTEDFDPTAITAVYNHLNKLMATEKRAAALFIFAPISKAILLTCEDADKFIVDTVMDLINKDKLDKICACFLLEYLSVYFEDNEEAAPPADTLASTILPLLTCDDQLVRYRSYKAFKSFIHSELFEKFQTVTLFLSKFNEFVEHDLLRQFFKLVSTFIYPEDDEEEDDDEYEDHGSQEMSILQPILDFSVQTLKTSDVALIKGHCLDTLADLAGRDQMFVENCYQDAMAQAEVLVAEKHYEAYPWLSAFFVAMTKCFFNETKGIIQKYLPTLVEAITNEKCGTQKDRLNFAADLSVMIGDGLADDLTPQLADFAMKFLSSDVMKEMMNSCAIFIGLRPKLTKELANQVFKIAAQRAMIVMDSEALNILVQTMRKLMKTFSIDEQVAEDFTNAIIEGKLAILYGQPPHLSKPPELFLFIYLERYVRRFPAKGAHICAQLIEWIAKAPFSVIPAILDPINAGLETSLINEKLATVLAGILSILLPQLDHHDAQELAATCTTMKEIYDIYPKVLEPIQPILDHLASVVSIIVSRTIAEEYEDDIEDIFYATNALPSIAVFILSIYATRDETPVNKDLLNGLLNFMPFPPETEENQEIFECLVQMMEDPDKYESILIPTLKIFTTMLLMKKAEVEQFEFEPDLLKEMKDKLRTIVKLKPEIGKAITKDFSDSRAKINRFNALIR